MDINGEQPEAAAPIRETDPRIHGLREAALRAILRTSPPPPSGNDRQPDVVVDVLLTWGQAIAAGGEDINPHTEGLSPGALAAMLVFDLTGDPASPLAPMNLTDLAMKVLTGGGYGDKSAADRINWVRWELLRLGYTEEAQHFTDQQALTGFLAQSLGHR